MQVGKEFAVLFAVLFLPGIVSQAGGVDPAGFEKLGYHLLILVVSIPQLLMVLYVSNLRIPGSSSRFGWRRPSLRDGGTALAGYVILIVSALAISALISAISVFIPSTGRALLPQVEWRFSVPALIPMAVLSSVAIGYREEVFFRAYIVDRASEIGVSTFSAVAGGTLLFALGHLYQGLAGFGVALLLGAVLGALYVRTRSLHGVAVAHGLYNLTILLLSGILPGTA